MKAPNLLFIMVASLIVFITSTPVVAEQDISSTLDKKKTLGILLFNGFEVLDAYGPIELWGNMKTRVQVVTIAAKRGEITSTQGPKTLADYGYDDTPYLWRRHGDVVNLVDLIRRA